MTAALRIRGLQVRRGDALVLPGLDLDVQPATVTGLLGPSGCGKTTLLRAIVGVQVVQAGEVTVLGQPAGSADLRRRVGYMAQGGAIYRDLTVTENLRYFARLLDSDGHLIEDVLHRVDLRRHADTRVENLSGGEQSRVSLAVTMLGEPDLLVLDEPTVGLDPVLRRDLWDLFASLAADGTTLLVSSHVMDEAERCQRLLLMREGRIIADDSPDGIRRSTGTDSVEAAFLSLVEGRSA